ncbi:Glycoside Hydrolase Family 18 protein [Trametes cinnabarina]|uniref:Glycoside Hydrolase Family 18 protein n=1 Tax=Pycnoporus cinnabarinus TaxID=5643 RepID=A0A060SNB8_PYCCI|nr:Glycoside Hydrolase Family 18 protein [Trametes cinnabarina]
MRKKSKGDSDKDQSPPDNATSPGNGTDASGEYGSTPAFVVYTDRTTNAPMLPAASDMEGYTVVYVAMRASSNVTYTYPSESALSFLLLSGAADQALAWQSLDDSDKHAFKEDYNSAGISIIVSAFGSTDAPTSTDADPVGTANTMAQWVLDNELDGVDVDYEDLNAMDAQDGKAEKWLVTFTETLRHKLPKGHYLLTHAPVAPWFSPTFNASGAYVTVHKQAGSLIDWYNVQFYNQGAGMYTTCDGLLNTAGSAFLGSSLNEIASAGIPLNKLVIGKYASDGDGANGYMVPQTLAKCVAQAKQQGWSAGVMFWEYPDADASLIKTVRGTAFPL